MKVLGYCRGFGGQQMMSKNLLNKIGKAKAASKRIDSVSVVIFLLSRRLKLILGKLSFSFSKAHFS